MHVCLSWLLLCPLDQDLPLQGMDIVCWKKGYAKSPKRGPSRLLWNTGERWHAQPVGVRMVGKRRI